MSDYLFRIDQKEKKKVEYICTDMSFIFKPLLKTYFLDSILLVDHFHVIRLINDQLNHTRKRIAQNKKSLEYRLLKHRNRILYSQNKYETYTISEHTERIRHVGNPRGSYKKIKEEIRTRPDPDQPPKAHDILKGILIMNQYSLALY